MRDRIVLRSGGQTGVDRAALDYAVANAIPYAGWCPRGGWAEDLPSPPGLLATYLQLTETPSDDPAERTKWNVRDSDATLVVTVDGVVRSPGTRFTITCAERLARPCCVLDLSSADSWRDAVRWLVEVTRSAARRPLVLNVAGPRESQSSGIYAAALTAIGQLLDEARVM